MSEQNPITDLPRRLRGPISAWDMHDLTEAAAVEIERLQAALDEIGRTALSCWTDMQGRLQDETHKRAHGVLGSIVRTAAAALPPP